MSELTRAYLELATLGIRERHPDAPDDEVRLRLASLWLERSDMVRLLGWNPEAMGLG